MLTKVSPPMLDHYLRRLTVRANPGIRAEAARLQANLGAATAALRAIESLQASSSDPYVSHGLKFIHSDVRWLKTACDWMSLDAREALCARVSKRRRRMIILSAMDAICAFRAQTGWEREWDAASLGHATVLGAASLLDPIIFYDVILSASRSGGACAMPVAPEIPHFADPPSVWCSFVLEICAHTEARPRDAANAAGRAA